MNLPHGTFTIQSSPTVAPALRPIIRRAAAGLLTCLAIISTTGIASAADRSPAVAISFNADQVRATGITPGGDAIVFGCLIGRYSGLPQLRRVAEVVHDEDRNGEITFDAASVPTTSVWVVVDLSSGRYHVSAPPATVAYSAEPAEMNLDEESWKEGVESLALRRSHLEWLVVRPGVGAWTVSSAEGGSLDADGTRNGKLRLNLGHMDSLAGDGALRKPMSVKSKDVLVVIDPHTLAFHVRGAR